MAELTPYCDDIISKYKTDCGDMIRKSAATYPTLVSQSHTQFLIKLLAISKQDIELSPDVFASFKILMNHARDCSRGRLRFTAECVPSSQRDIGHEVENNRTREIYLEMHNSFSRMKQKLKESAESCRIDELLSEEEGGQEVRSNVYDWLNEGEEKEEEEQEEEKSGANPDAYDWEQTRQERISKKQQHKRHRENIRLLQEQVRESRDSQLSDIRADLAAAKTTSANTKSIHSINKSLTHAENCQRIAKIVHSNDWYLPVDLRKLK
jgi:hypothetical protein